MPSAKRPEGCAARQVRHRLWSGNQSKFVAWPATRSIAAPASARLSWCLVLCRKQNSLQRGATSDKRWALYKKSLNRACRIAGARCVKNFQISFRPSAHRQALAQKFVNVNLRPPCLGFKKQSEREEPRSPAMVNGLRATRTLPRF